MALPIGSTRLGLASLAPNTKLTFGRAKICGLARHKFEVDDLFKDIVEGYRIPNNIFIKLLNLEWEKITPRSIIKSGEFKLSDPKLDREKRAPRFKSGEAKKHKQEREGRVRLVQTLPP